MGLFRKDAGGQIFTLDLLLALIPLTLIIGMAAANMDNMLYLTQSAVFQSSTERVAADTVNTLIETSGSPYNWEHVGNPQVAGLARFDHRRRMPVENHLSPSKLNALQDQHIQNLLGPEYGFFLNIRRADNRNIHIKSLGKFDNTASNIVRIERLVLTSDLSTLQLETSLEDLMRVPGRPRTYTTVFQTNSSSVATRDYWILVINRGYASARIRVNDNTVVGPGEFKPHVRKIRRQINHAYLQNQPQLIDNIVSVRGTSKPGSSMDVFVISAPRGTSEDQINLDNLENIRLRQALFEFYVWVR